MATPIPLSYEEKTKSDVRKHHATNLGVQTTLATTGHIANQCLHFLPSFQRLGLVGRPLLVAQKIAENTLFQTIRKETTTAGIRGIHEGIPAGLRFSDQGVANRARAFRSEKGMETPKEHEEISIEEHTKALIAERLAMKLTMLGINSVIPLPPAVNEWVENSIFEATQSILQPHIAKKTYTSMAKLPLQIEKEYTEPCKQILEETRTTLQKTTMKEEYALLNKLKERYEIQQRPLRILAFLAPFRTTERK